jgi:hypothetical protein
MKHLVSDERGFDVEEDYRYYSLEEEVCIYGKARDPQFYEDANAYPPNVSFCEETKRWVLSFASADFGGYCVTTLKWYFISRKDIIALIFGEGWEKILK